MTTFAEQYVPSAISTTVSTGGISSSADVEPEQVPVDVSGNPASNLDEILEDHEQAISTLEQGGVIISDLPSLP